MNDWKRLTMYWAWTGATLLGTLFVSSVIVAMLTSA